TGPLATQSADGKMHFSQPLPSIINIPAGKKALLRISDLDVTEYQTLASLGIPMTVIGYNAKLLRDQAGNNLYYNTNSITLGAGHHWDDLQPDGPRCFYQPAGRSVRLLLGVWLQQCAFWVQSSGHVDAGCHLPHDAGSRSHADRHGRTNGHGQPDQ